MSCHRHHDSFPAMMKTILPRLTQDKRVTPPRGPKDERLIRRLQQRSMGAHLADWIGRWPSPQRAWQALEVPCDLVHWVRYTHELSDSRTPVGSTSHRLLTRLCVAAVRTKIHLASDPAFEGALAALDAWAQGDASVAPAQVEQEIYDLLVKTTATTLDSKCVESGVRHAATCAKGCYGDAELAVRMVDGMDANPTMANLLRRLAPVPPPFFVDP